MPRRVIRIAALIVSRISLTRKALDLKERLQFNEFRNSCCFRREICYTKVNGKSLRSRFLGVTY